ncbi:uncharacterized protein LOC119675650 [Teleopsis dalmanni]|uniref:uncharacterized protein LOC119675650 n=1 Tax=Teleopsis dalmanni TaxID=139649 RepID=UPI0018CD5816|nr:uncharacterized protein LOC119675650 [Teleopsis dalmanni]
MCTVYSGLDDVSLKIFKNTCRDGLIKHRLSQRLTVRKRNVITDSKQMAPIQDVIYEEVKKFTEEIIHLIDEYLMPNPVNNQYKMELFILKAESIYYLAELEADNQCKSSAQQCVKFYHNAAVELVKSLPQNHRCHKMINDQFLLFQAKTQKIPIQSCNYAKRFFTRLQERISQYERFS